ncbi:polysaccharide pyruvyl transferase WcaK-like protein [Texcoconibacillus texcoconensis]|uniref:Polysaccharide pyruvyl transferase WcaK-like protein n=2 Tax=Texcoconibacillus texcoconensis TaxID=1095777 RepID=A0A840QMJ8_9BACI|nr:polysaccharide pyruvyl transferase WcaK-like protein [Texcoconibacillus texcoconensis]
MKKLGVKAPGSFDSLPVYIQGRFPEGMRKDTKRVVFSGSAFGKSRRKDRIVNQQVHYIQFLQDQGYEVVFLTGAKSNPAKDDEEFIDLLREQLPNLPVVEAKSLDEWLTVIGRAGLLVSARFHHTIAAACLGTPFITLNSNTPKINGIMEMFQEHKPIKYDVPDLEGQ